MSQLRTSVLIRGPRTARAEAGDLEGLQRRHPRLRAGDHRRNHLDTGSPGSPWAEASGICPAATGSPSTISFLPRSSPRTGGRTPARGSTRTCFGPFEAAAEFRCRDHVRVPAASGGRDLRRADLLRRGGRRNLVGCSTSSSPTHPRISEGSPASISPHRSRSSPRSGTSNVCLAVARWAGPIEEGEKMLKPFRDARRSEPTSGPMPYPALNSAFDALSPRACSLLERRLRQGPQRRCDRAHVEHGSTVPEVTCTMHLYPINGACQRVGANETAFAYRDASYGLVICRDGATRPRTTNKTSGYATTTKRCRPTRTRAATSTSCTGTTTDASRQLPSELQPLGGQSRPTTPTTSSTSTRTSSRKPRTGCAALLRRDDGRSPGLRTQDRPGCR